MIVGWLGRAHSTEGLIALVLRRARPVSSPECLEAYELDPELHTLGLSDTHSRIVKRGRKSGRAGEYTYSFGKHKRLITPLYLNPTGNLTRFDPRRCSPSSPCSDNLALRTERRPSRTQMHGRVQLDHIRLWSDRFW